MSELAKSMKIQQNETFMQLLAEYHLSGDLSFSIDLPKEIQNIIEDKIVISEFGITLDSFSGLYKAKETWENQSIIEDNENHFHVESFIDPPDNKKAFMLGVKTLIALAERFQVEKINGIRFWFSFQTPELGQQFAKANHLDELGDKHYISDRLSFYKRRENEVVVTLNQSDNSFCALMIIDI